MVGIFLVGDDVGDFYSGDRWGSGSLGMEFKTYPCGKDESGNHFILRNGGLMVGNEGG